MIQSFGSCCQDGQGNTSVGGRIVHEYKKGRVAANGNGKTEEKARHSCSERERLGAC